MRRALERQGWHLLAWVALGTALLALEVPAGAGVGGGLGVPHWVAISWAAAGVHQGWTAVWWRRELHASPPAEGRRRRFLVFRIGFVLSAAIRFLPVVPVAWASRGTLGVPPVIALGLIVLTTPLILWALYGAFVHLTLPRAFGIDHFDPAYRGGTLVRRGIFRHVRNPLYAAALLALYHPALLWQSAFGLVFAAAHHGFVWTHYLCTERPDLRIIYGAPARP